MRKRGESRRTAIIAAAAQAFADQGYGRTSISDIVFRCGGSRQTLYHRFPSKNELFIEAIQWAAKHLPRQSSDRFILDGNIRQDLQIYGERCLAWAQAPEVLSLRRLVISESGRSEIGRILWQETRSKSLKRIGETLSAAMASGKLRSADPIVATSHLLALIEAELVEAVVLCARSPATDDEIQKMVNRAIDAFVAAYRPESCD